mmetsp:Transcript_53963/g.101307  ORF Transcript_53963/g.101307 Transcript_53963/m.101307 type:complete len:188 (+) Transcript_53963:122-685(+)
MTAGGHCSMLVFLGGMALAAGAGSPAASASELLAAPANARQRSAAFLAGKKPRQGDRPVFGGRNCRFMKPCGDDSQCGCYLNQCMGGIRLIGGPPKPWQVQSPAGAVPTGEAVPAGLSPSLIQQEASGPAPAPGPMYAPAPFPGFADEAAMLPAAPAPPRGQHKLWGCQCCHRNSDWSLGNMPPWYG